MVPLSSLEASYSTLRSIFILGLSALLTSPAFADSEPKAAADPATIIVQKLSAVRPDLGFNVLGESSMSGMYEVQVDGGPILLVAKDGNYFIDGNLYQVTPTQFVDIKEIRMTAMRRQIFATYNTDDMIIFKPKGESKAIINVFTDIDCGYCRKLHKEVPMLNAMGVEVRYLAYPRAGLESDSYSKIATAWCADDPNQALTDFKTGSGRKFAVCDDNPVASQYALGGSIGVNGTPATVLMDGTLLPGYRTAADFAQLLGLDVRAN
tara:strand:- start:290 stop:1084 length:795 start_codon:yes stop_codon:yes gene_type:complete